MPEANLLDRLIKNVRVVRPNHPTIELLDLGVRDGKFAEIGPTIEDRYASEPSPALTKR